MGAFDRRQDNSRIKPAAAQIFADIRRRFFRLVPQHRGGAHMGGNQGLNRLGMFGDGGTAHRQNRAGLLREQL